MVLELKNIKKSFGSRTVIQDINLTIESGKFVSLLGASGCGKTTLLRLIAGLETPDSGSINHDERTYYDSNQHTYVSPAERDLGMVFQDFALWPHMTVFQNVAYPLKVNKDTKDLKTRVMQALKEVHLEEHYDKAIHQLSGGQQQRVSLARAIISQSKLILMDEPLSALDASLREDMQLLIQRLIKTYDMTAIFVTHDQYEAMSMSDYIAVMSNGSIVQYGTPETLYQHPKNKEVATFIGKGTFLEGVSHNQVLSTNEGFQLNHSIQTKEGKYGVLIRPEHVHIEEATHSKATPAVIETVSFTGERYQYTASSHGVSIMFYDSNYFQENETVNLTFDIPENYFIKMGKLNMKQFTKYIVILIATVVLLAACQNKPENGDKGSNSSKSSSNDGNSKDKLVLYAAGPDNLVNDMVKQFEKQTGKKVQVFQGTTGEILGRLEAEKDNPKADVVQLASLPAALDYKKKGLIEPYKVKNHKKLYKDWIDKDGYYYGFSGSALDLSYNTKNVKNPPKDVKDLTQSKFKNKIAIPDPSESGTALDLLSIKVNNEGSKAWDEYKALKQNGMKLAGANKPALESVIKGDNDVVYGGVDYMVYAAKAKGEPVDIKYPKSGTAISPRPAFILKSSKHKELAKKYMDYVTSSKGQKQVDDHYLIPADKSVEKKKCKAKRKDIKEYKYDWNHLSDKSEKVLKKFTELMR